MVKKYPEKLEPHARGEEADGLQRKAGRRRREAVRLADAQFAPGPIANRLLNTRLSSANPRFN
jgi:hypothetical protein